MDSIQATVGIIGAGSMGSAIARGLVASGALESHAISVCDPSAEKRAALEELGIVAYEDADKLAVAGTDAVILAVKPQVLPEVVRGIAPALKDRLVISIAAGVALSTLEALMDGARVVRVMPNLPIQVLSGASAIAPGARALPEDTELTRKIFGALGTAWVMREDQLDAEGAVIGTGPAFFALFVDTLTRAGIRAGLPAAATREMCEATMRGVAQTLLDSKEHPRAYVEKVTSPGGTTAEALLALEPLLIDGSYAAVDAALERTRELAGK
ncbi:MAG: pyrroline-5-carboxylate reductase [Atopobiaceae bacterium]|jgi:pyrroline-5-carboxylate reductase